MCLYLWSFVKCLLIFFPLKNWLSFYCHSYFKYIYQIHILQIFSFSLWLAHSLNGISRWAGGGLLSQHKREKSSDVTDLKKQVDQHFFFSKCRLIIIPLSKSKLNFRRDNLWRPPFRKMLCCRAKVSHRKWVKREHASTKWEPEREVLKCHQHCHQTRKFLFLF